MRYHALACDYDGTIALHGRVDQATIEALESVKKSGRKLVLVTGRELDELLQIFQPIELFDRVVAENGALLYRPATRKEVLLGETPPPEFARELIRRGAARVSVGRVIVATWEPHETTVLEVIRDQGLELQVIFNKGAVMVLPSGINKATGLHAALLELGLSAHNVVSVGDAENDHAFLGVSECSVAVANALDTLKQRVDLVTKSDHGAGVSELIHDLVNADLSNVGLQSRHNVVLGTCSDGTDLAIQPYGTNILIAGSSCGGKSTLATGFLERLGEKSYQYLIVDPEGDYSSFQGGVVLGDNQRAPAVTEVLDLLQKPDENVVVNLIGINLKQRPGFFETLLPRVQELRARTGRPHWILVDEAHHVLPSSWEAAGLTVPQQVYGMMLITPEPDRVAPAILSSMDVVIAVGEKPEDTLRIFSDAVGQESPNVPSVTLDHGEALAWFWRKEGEPFWFRSITPKTERRRHRRKYPEGELPPGQCFYFRGPEDKLNLRAQNLSMFLQLSDGVDDETWLFHLKNGDFSTWFHNVIKDPELAQATQHLEVTRNVTASEGRRLIRTELENRYILAA